MAREATFTFIPANQLEKKERGLIVSVNKAGYLAFSQKSDELGGGPR